MARPPRAPWSNPDDYLAFSVLILLVGIAFGTYFGWQTYHARISLDFAIAADWQVRLYEHFTHDLDRLDAVLAYGDYSRVTPGQILAVLGALGREVRTPVAILILLLGVVCFVRAAPSRFTRRHDLAALIRELAPHFPVVTAFADRELRLVSPNLGRLRPLDPALHPTEWVDRYARDSKGCPNRRMAKAAFIAQLGPLWRGPENASPVVRVLFSAFALHLAGRRPEAVRLLGDFSIGLRNAGGETEAGPDDFLDVPAGTLDLADRFIADNLLTEVPRKIASHHAYAHGALMSVLIAARKRSGVLPPAAFLATKLVDRLLWYSLHSLGFPGETPRTDVHPNPRIEAAGARAHWSAETLAGAPLAIPHVDAAVEACWSACSSAVRNG